MDDKDKQCYTFYAYKPYSSSRYDDSYDDEHMFLYEQTYAQVIDLWARCLLRNKDLGYCETGWDDITVLKNGRSHRGLMNDNETHIDDCDAFKRELEEIEDEAEKLATTWHKQAKQGEAEKIAAQKKRVEEAALEVRRNMYESLKKEFEK